MRWLIVLPLLGMALPLVVSGKENKDTKSPMEKFQGEWIIASLGFGGYELKGTAERPMMVSFHKDRIVIRPTYNIRNSARVSFGSGGVKTDQAIEFSISERDTKGIFQLHPDKNPAWIDLKPGEEDQGVKGIYRFKRDELELCINRFANAKRPDDFKMSDSAILLRLKRKAKKD